MRRAVRLVSVKERQFASLFGYSVADGEPLPDELLRFGVQVADGWRRLGAGGDQLAQQLLDADVDIVADAAHHLDRLAGRCGPWSRRKLRPARPTRR